MHELFTKYLKRGKEKKDEIIRRLKKNNRKNQNTVSDTK